MPSNFTWPISCQPEVVIAGRFPFSAATVAREYRHATFALHQHHYRGRLRLARQIFNLRPGDVTLTPPDVVSRYELQRDGYHLCIHFRPVPIESKIPVLHLPLHLPLRGGGRVAEQMRAVAEAFATRGTAAREKLGAAAAGSLLQSLLLQLALGGRPSLPAHRETRAENLLVAAKDLIEHEFPKPLSIEDIAKASGLSRNYFSAQFRQRFGRTPQGHLLHCRLEAARALLLSTRLPVKEIAFECGLPDPHHFNKLFRQTEGVSPSAYRAQHANKW
jgi:AraC-like DNA-binding protein